MKPALWTKCNTRFRVAGERVGSDPGVGGSGHTTPESTGCLSQGRAHGSAGWQGSWLWLRSTRALLIGNAGTRSRGERGLQRTRQQQFPCFPGVPSCRGEVTRLRPPSVSACAGACSGEVTRPPEPLPPHPPPLSPRHRISAPPRFKSGVGRAATAWGRSTSRRERSGRGLSEQKRSSSPRARRSDPPASPTLDPARGQLRRYARGSG